MSWGGSGDDVFDDTDMESGTQTGEAYQGDSGSDDSSSDDGDGAFANNPMEEGTQTGDAYQGSSGSSEGDSDTNSGGSSAPPEDDADDSGTPFEETAEAERRRLDQEEEGPFTDNPMEEGTQTGEEYDGPTGDGGGGGGTSQPDRPEPDTEVLAGPAYESPEGVDYRPPTPSEADLIEQQTDVDTSDLRGVRETDEGIKPLLDDKAIEERVRNRYEDLQTPGRSPGSGSETSSAEQPIPGVRASEIIVETRGGETTVQLTEEGRRQFAAAQSGDLTVPDIESVSETGEVELTDEARVDQARRQFREDRAATSDEVDFDPRSGALERDANQQAEESVRLTDFRESELNFEVTDEGVEVSPTDEGLERVTRQQFRENPEQFAWDPDFDPDAGALERDAMQQADQQISITEFGPNDVRIDVQNGSVSITPTEEALRREQRERAAERFDVSPDRINLQHGGDGFEIATQREDGEEPVGTEVESVRGEDRTTTTGNRTLLDGIRETETDILGPRRRREERIINKTTGGLPSEIQAFEEELLGPRRGREERFLDAVGDAVTGAAGSAADAIGEAAPEVRVDVGLTRPVTSRDGPAVDVGVEDPGVFGDIEVTRGGGDLETEPSVETTPGATTGFDRDAVPVETAFGLEAGEPGGEFRDPRIESPPGEPATFDRDAVDVETAFGLEVGAPEGGFRDPAVETPPGGAAGFDRDAVPVETAFGLEAGDPEGGFRDPGVEMPPGGAAGFDRDAVDTTATQRAVGDAADSAEATVDDFTRSLERRLPGRTGTVAAAGVGVAAIPEPTPATEIAGGTIALGAAAVGGTILAAQAIQDRSELDPGRSTQEVDEIEPTGTAVTGSELDPTGDVGAATEVEPAPLFGEDELEAGGEVATTTSVEIGERGGDSEDGAAGEDTVVPGEFPLPGRDLPSDPTRDSGQTTKPEDVLDDGVETSPVMDEPAQRRRERSEERSFKRDEQDDYISRVIDEYPGEMFIGRQGPSDRYDPRRRFPTGAGAVIGVEQREEEAQRSEIQEEAENVERPWEVQDPRSDARASYPPAVGSDTKAEPRMNIGVDVGSRVAATTRALTTQDLMSNQMYQQQTTTQQETSQATQTENQTQTENVNESLFGTSPAYGAPSGMSLPDFPFGGDENDDRDESGVAVDEIITRFPAPLHAGGEPVTSSGGPDISAIFGQ